MAFGDGVGNGSAVIGALARRRVDRAVDPTERVSLDVRAGEVGGGGGLEPDTTMGPPAHPRRGEAMANLVADASARGAGPRTTAPRSPIDPDPRACRFHGRCPRESDICAIDPPELRTLEPGREARCHFPVE